MGRIERQSILNTIITYAGMALGYVNTGLLFPNLLETEQVGTVNLLIVIATLFAQLAALGFPNTTLKFFPFFRTANGQHHGYLAMFCLVTLAGFTLFAALTWLFRERIAVFFNASPMLMEYFWYVLPLGFFTLYYNVLMTYLRSHHNTVMPSFFKDFLLKVMVTLSIALYAFGLVDFPTFVLVYVLVNISVTFMLLAYTWRTGELKFSRFRLPPSVTFKALLVYSLFALLGNSSQLLTGKVDAIILASLMDEHYVGIYVTAFSFISAIEVPWRSMSKIASPQVAEYWSKNDMAQMQRLYKRVSLINTIVATALFVGLWSNLHNVFRLIPEDYAAGYSVILIVGIGKMVDLITGLNGIIILTSDKYRWDLIFNLLLVGLVIGLDYALIPKYGIDGAAFGTMIALVLFNLSRLFFVQLFYKMNPLDWKLLMVLIIGGIALIPGLLIPPMPLVIDIVVRSLIVSIIFFGAVYLLKISDDANRVGDRVLRWVGMKR